MQRDHPWLWKAPAEELHSARSRLSTMSLLSPRTPAAPAAMNKFRKAVGGVIAARRMGGLNMGVGNLGLVPVESKLLDVAALDGQ